MTHGLNLSSFRLADLPAPFKVVLTALLALLGGGYLVALLNIYEHHHDADLDPAMTLDDLRRVYHGLDKAVTQEARVVTPSRMSRMVRPGGAMRKHLEKGGEPAIRSLTAWLDRGAAEADFARPGASAPGDPSPRDVIAARCIRCHNATDGEMSDVPYADSASATPRFELVAKVATPVLGPTTTETKTIHLAPTGCEELVQITHAHVLSIPLFTLVVTALFLLTGLPAKFKAVVAPIPMIAVCCDLASWWLARVAEPFVYVIAAAGAVFGASYGLQILCVAGSMWLEKRTELSVQRGR